MLYKISQHIKNHGSTRPYRYAAAVIVHINLYKNLYKAAV